jgi:hypothetical protein
MNGATFFITSFSQISVHFHKIIKFLGVEVTYQLPFPKDQPKLNKNEIKSQDEIRFRPNSFYL